MSANEETPAKRECGQKNTEKVHCMFCSTKILNVDTATFDNVEYLLPRIYRKKDDFSDELITDCWLVKDIYTFENIGVSQTLGEFRYLMCADCDRGPIGWHDYVTEKYYIALTRVKHE